MRERGERERERGRNKPYNIHRQPCSQGERGQGMNRRECQQGLWSPAVLPKLLRVLLRPLHSHFCDLPVLYFIQKTKQKEKEKEKKKKEKTKKKKQKTKNKKQKTKNKNNTKMVKLSKSLLQQIKQKEGRGRGRGRGSLHPHLSFSLLPLFLLFHFFFFPPCKITSYSTKTITLLTINYLFFLQF
jgi:hypothetical protein